MQSQRGRQSSPGKASIQSQVLISETNSSGCQARPVDLDGGAPRKASALGSISKKRLTRSVRNAAAKATSCSPWSMALERVCWRTLAASSKESLRSSGKRALRTPTKQVELFWECCPSRRSSGRLRCRTSHTAAWRQRRAGSRGQLRAGSLAWPRLGHKKLVPIGNRQAGAQAWS